MITLNEIRNFKMFKLTINNKRVACYWDLDRNEYQFFRCKQKLNNLELQEMKNLIRRKLDDPRSHYLNNPVVIDFKQGQKVFDTISGNFVYLFQEREDNKGFPGVLIDHGRLDDTDIEFRYYNQLRLVDFDDDNEEIQSKE